MDLTTRLLLGLCGSALLSLTGYIVWKQTKAKSCKLHSRTAGRVAMGLGGICSVVGLALLVLAMTL
ncbi:MAG: hypothetical protein KDA93_22795 [Planctomycetaceae bacterium]|nr:hypothetical protein [Planctomycetaceae bacterium]